MTLPNLRPFRPWIHKLTIETPNFTWFYQLKIAPKLRKLLERDQNLTISKDDRKTSAYKLGQPFNRFSR